MCLARIFHSRFQYDYYKLRKTFSESDQISKIYNVKKTLKNNCDYWQNIFKANDFMIYIIQKGYMLLLHTVPEPAEFKNNNLLRTNRILEVESVSHVVNPLSVTC